MIDKDLKKSVGGRKVILGLSGGVDSAVAAVLLQDAGAEVEALHMTNWEDDDGYCTAADDLQDARTLCEQLGICLHHVNFARQYRDQVFAYFLDSYRAGRTPNPDVLCNREIKFGVFRDYATRLGAERIATGHYARCGSIDGRPALFRGIDPGKDQSYFLHAIEEDAVANSVFPLGGMRKADVRNIARDRGLAVAAKKDSTGICFIGERPFREFLATYLPAQPGPIVSVDGETVGEHGGLMYYTPGQRQGLHIGGRADRAELPWYVIDKSIEDNTLIVAQGDHERLYSDWLLASEPHWIGTPPVSAGGYDCHAKLRHRQADQACRILPHPAGMRVEFAAPQRAIAAGQFAVFYAGERCLGGATIDSTGRN